jgi:hypothetical protein
MASDISLCQTNTHKEQFNEQFTLDHLHYFINAILNCGNQSMQEKGEDYEEMFNMLEPIVVSQNTLNLALFFANLIICLNNVDINISVDDTTFISLIYPCNLLKPVNIARTQKEQEYFNRLRLFYNTWCPSLKKMAICESEKISI